MFSICCNYILRFLIVISLISSFLTSSFASSVFDVDNLNNINLKAKFDITKDNDNLENDLKSINVENLSINISDDNLNARINSYSVDTQVYLDSYFIVQFNENVNDEFIKDYEKKGIIFYSYIPENAYIIKLSKDTLSVLKEDIKVNWIGKYKPEYKYDKSLIDVFNDNKNDMVVFNVVLLENEYVNNFVDFLEDNKYNNFQYDNVFFQIKLDDVEDLLEISDLDYVYRIEEFKPFELLNDVATNITSVNILRENIGLYGDGQIVAVADSGIDTGIADSSMHQDIRGRIIGIVSLNYTGVQNDGASDNNSGHGTHVVGSVLGNGLESGSNPGSNDFANSFAGMAPKAKLHFTALEYYCGTNHSEFACFFSDYVIKIPLNLTRLFEYGYNASARIFSNSWGISSGDYDVSSQSADEFVWNNRDALLVFAAGNDGEDWDDDGVIDEESILTPANAKNVLTVGASENVRSEGGFSKEVWNDTFYGYWIDPIANDLISDNKDGIAAFSSRGPTYDGRIKPDIVAPGTDIISTRSSISIGQGWGIYDSFYMYLGGTSMATPIVSGASAIVRENLVKNKGFSDPSAALMKALLINTADDISPGQYGGEINTRPDMNQGWGRMNVSRAVSSDDLREIVLLDEPMTLNTLSKYKYRFKIEDDEQKDLRVTIVWTDPASSISASKNLVNDIDLIVHTPSGDFYGNDKDLPYNDNFDRLNNVEGVDIYNLAQGDYEVEVVGYDIVKSVQNFALVITYLNPNKISHVEVSSPIDDFYYNTSDILLNLSLSRKGYVRYSLNDIDINVSMNSNDNFSFYKNLNLVDGDYNLTFHIFNTTLGYQKSINYSFVVDTIKPTISSINLINNSYYCNLSLNLSLDENSTMAFVMENFSRSFLSNKDFNFDVNLTPNIEKEVNLSFYLTDRAGNNNNYVYNVTIDTIKPMINLSLEDNSVFNSSNVNFSWISNKQVRSVVRFNDTNYTPTTSDNLTFNISFIGFKDKWNKANISLYDRFNNTVKREIIFGIDITDLEIDKVNTPSNINVSSLTLPLDLIFNKEIRFVKLDYNGIIYVRNLSQDMITNNFLYNLSLEDYGVQNITFDVEDLFGNNKTFNLVFDAKLKLNSKVNDTDGDGINNSFDRIFGNLSNVDSNLNNLTIRVDGDVNLSKIFNSTYNISIEKDNYKLVEFKNNFTNNAINLTKLSVKEEFENKSKFLVRGLDLMENMTKTIFFNLTGNITKFGSLCLKDSEVNSFSQLSFSCNLADEYYINTLPYNKDGISVNYINNSTTLVQIEGLKHSAVVQMCKENWEYSAWSSCQNSLQTRTATDFNDCGTTILKEVTSRSCTSTSNQGSTSDSDNDNDDDDDSSKGFVPKNIDDDSKPHEFVEPAAVYFFNYDLLIDDSTDYKDEYKSEIKIVAKSKSGIRMFVFTHNFSESDLDLKNFRVETGKSSQGESFVFLKGIVLDDTKKYMRFEKSINSTSVCLKKESISNVDEISLNCNNSYEFILPCDGQDYNGLTCFDKKDFYLITGDEIYAAKEFIGQKNVISQDESRSDVVLLGKEGQVDEDISSNDNLEENNENNIYFFVGIGIVILFVIFILIVVNLNVKQNRSKKIIRRYVLTYKDNYPENSIKEALIRNGHKKILVNRIYEEVRRL